MFPRPGGPCLCGHSSSSCFLLWKLFDCSSTTAAPAASSSSHQQQAASSRQQQGAAGSSRQQQAAAGISRQQQTQANAAVSATAAVKQLAASQYSKLFVGDFRRDVPASGNAYFGLCSSFRAMVFPRPGGPCLCAHHLIYDITVI